MKERKTEYDIDPLFTDRWSPRSLIPKDMPDNELMKLFEAARWAPSSYNSQPWRFIYAKRGTAYWDKFFNLLAGPNQAWCKNASVLIVLVSKNTFDYNGLFSNTHTLSAGAAWENLALQAVKSNLIAHGMSGFDYKKVKKELKVPFGYTVEMMIAVGYKGKKEDLPENLQKGEVPSGRKSIKEIVCEGKFSF